MKPQSKLFSLGLAAVVFTACSQSDPTGVVLQKKSPDASHQLIKDEGFQNTGPIKKCSWRNHPDCDF